MRLFLQLVLPLGQPQFRFVLSLTHGKDCSLCSRYLSDFVWACQSSPMERRPAVQIKPRRERATKVAPDGAPILLSMGVPISICTAPEYSIRLAHGKRNPPRSHRFLDQTSERFRAHRSHFPPKFPRVSRPLFPPIRAYFSVIKTTGCAYAKLRSLDSIKLSQDVIAFDHLLEIPAPCLRDCRSATISSLRYLGYLKV